MIEVRTWQDFVEDMITDGRSIKKIRVVAFATRWRGFLPEIIDYARKLKKIAKFKRNNLKSEKEQHNVINVCIACTKINCKKTCNAKRKSQ